MIAQPPQGPGPCLLPSAAVSRTAQTSQRFAIKAQNFKASVESTKTSIEQEHSDCQRRRQVLEAGLQGAGAGEETRRALSSQFVEREAKGLLAKFKQRSTEDYESMAVLGAGAFGTVFLVREKDTEPEKYFAVKQMTKQRHTKKNIKKGVFNERDVLAKARSQWFVELFATFQDADHIYMVMEFVPGGDLFKWMEWKERFSLPETRFYMAELLKALDVLHKHGFVHRDIKFDNMVLGANGHLKLLDFGLCKVDPASDQAHETSADPSKADASVQDLKSCLKGDKNKRRQMASQVGTVHYMACEIFRGEVSAASDIWSVGVMTFECLYGSPCFHAYHVDDEVQRRAALKQSILNHAQILPGRLLKAKRNLFIDDAAEQFLRNIICEPEDRSCFEKCRQDAFFQGLDFDRLQFMTPPFLPELSGPADTRNFDEHPFKPLKSSGACGAWKDQALEWANYEFDREAFELQRPEAMAQELFPPVPAQAPTGISPELSL
eukprot:TRINITY_DN14734_c0_g1_i1.p1 TRINITY_DN14734_c0_g1~~TRINITY_DN14734_c0_g1_i1.p1  ORF type:complete len:509 (+),score=109.15 TRINITY_DN14734_c0_g1_i1:50-1528(+)